VFCSLIILKLLYVFCKAGFCVNRLDQSCFPFYFAALHVHSNQVYFNRSALSKLQRSGVIPAQAGILKLIALGLFIRFLLFKGIHEHYVVPNQVGNDDPRTIIFS